MGTRVVRVVKMAKAEAAKEIRRKQLIDATMRAIGRYGYASLTLTHVAGEAGLSPASSISTSSPRTSS